MKKLFLLFTLAFVAMSCEMGDEKLDDFIGRDDSSVATIPNNQIWYTSTDGKIVESYSGIENNYADFGVNIVSNTYVDGKGVIEFDGDVTTIGHYVFYRCRSLTSVTIPDSVTTIGEGAFYWCNSLTSVYCKAITPPAGGIYMFSDNASGRKIYVPMESVEAYKSASYWSEYADDIVGYNF